MEKIRNIENYKQMMEDEVRRRSVCFRYTFAVCFDSLYLFSALQL